MEETRDDGRSMFAEGATTNLAANRRVAILPMPASPALPPGTRP